MNETRQSFPDPRRGEAGFTLVEALIAIVIFAFGIIAVSNLFLVAASSNVVANQSAAATDTAASILENLKAQPFSALTAKAYPTAPDQTVSIPGVSQIESRWSITNIEGPTGRTKFILVRSEGTGVLTRFRSAAEFTTYRTCTTPALGCP